MLGLIYIGISSEEMVRHEVTVSEDVFTRDVLHVTVRPQLNNSDRLVSLLRHARGAAETILTAGVVSVWRANHLFAPRTATEVDTLRRELGALAAAFVGSRELQVLEDGDMEPAATEVLQHFYGGRLPVEVFQAARDPALERTGEQHLAVATTRRFPPEDQVDLLVALCRHLPMTDMQFGMSGYNIHGMVPTGFVTKDEVAQQAVRLLPFYVD